MNFILSNPIQGQSRLTTDHPASSYGIPVLLNERGEAFGPHDIIGGDIDDPLNWMFDHPMSAGELVMLYGLAPKESRESPEHYEERISASRLFLAILT